MGVGVAVVSAGAGAASVSDGTITWAPGIEAVPNHYIVTLKESLIRSDVGRTSAALVRAYGGRVDVTWQHSLHGFAVTASEQVARRIAGDPRVAAVHPDGWVRATATQLNPPSWGLDRVDQRNLPLDSLYTYPVPAAGVVRAYIIDTGIRITHRAFGGRASWGTNTVDSVNTDCDGHGTHVAGTVGGTEYGVAKSVQLIAVKVLDCNGNGSYAQIISGVEWVTANGIRPAVANMSLGKAPYDPLDTAVRASIARGITYVVSSGNDHADACGTSPARVGEAITVNATSSSDWQPYFSNYGSCTDIFAPGVGILSAGHTSDTDSRVEDGTSMAAPHVSGAAALLLFRHPSATPAQIHAALIACSTKDKVNLASGTSSPNRLLYSGICEIEPVTAPVDFTNDGRDDLGLTGHPDWNTLPLALSTGSGAFTVTNRDVGLFAGQASVAGMKVLPGDYDDDGRTDLALIGASFWNTIPVAFSRGDGTFTTTNTDVENFPRWAAVPGVTVVPGDFNDDGRADLALTGGGGWNTMPVAYSNGNGTFTVTNGYVGDFAAWATTTGARPIPGDFNNDGRTDVALVGGEGWNTLPIAFATGNGSFTVTNRYIGGYTFHQSVRLWGAKPVPGDFDNDGRTDIALAAESAWSSIPLAVSQGDGGFLMYSRPVGEFASWSAAWGAKVVPGDFNNDGRMDLALTGAPFWRTIPVAFSNGDGTFTVTNRSVSNFPAFAEQLGATIVAGDFNNDGRTDLAATGVLGWSWIPVAFSNGDGSFTSTSNAVTDFGAWAATPGIMIV